MVQREILYNIQKGKMLQEASDFAGEFKNGCKKKRQACCLCSLFTDPSHPCLFSWSLYYSISLSYCPYHFIELKKNQLSLFHISSQIRSCRPYLSSTKTYFPKLRATYSVMNYVSSLVF